MRGKIRGKSEGIRKFLLENAERYPHVATLAAKRFAITRQAISKHLQNLTSEGALIATGNTKNRAYKLGTLSEWERMYPLEEGLAEDVVWRDIASLFNHFPENVVDIWHFCFTEMFNNAIDHSEGRKIFVHVTKTASNTQIVLCDDGIGIFRKIQTVMNLSDERHAILELSKGKLTTDPARHTGQGIFFTSRLLDSFDILSGSVYFSHVLGDEKDWVVERPQFQSGTAIFMKLNNHTSRTCRKVFDQYSDHEDLGFVKTVVPVRLAQYGNEKLISRSQAKRVLGRVELFKTVIFDFEGVPTIGQAFADEIFRVFANAHPEIEILSLHTNTEVKRMIQSSKMRN